MSDAYLYSPGTVFLVFEAGHFDHMAISLVVEVQLFLLFEDEYLAIFDLKSPHIFSPDVCTHFGGQSICTAAMN